MEALTEKIQKTLERRQKTAFLAGFLASCESCEYPYEGNGAA